VLDRAGELFFFGVETEGCEGELDFEESVADCDADDGVVLDFKRFFQCLVKSFAKDPT
jgi:hypothetical protein